MTLTYIIVKNVYSTKNSVIPSMRIFVPHSTESLVFARSKVGLVHVEEICHTLGEVGKAVFCVVG